MYTRRKQLSQVSSSPPDFSPSIVQSHVRELEHLSRNEQESDLPIAIRKGTRECLKYHKFLGDKNYYCAYPLNKVISYDTLSPTFKLFIASLDSQHILETIEEALSHGKWKEAVNSEMSALIKNHTWELVPISKDISPVGCK